MSNRGASPVVSLRVVTFQHLLTSAFAPARSLKQTQTAVKSARAARKKRWFCFGVIVVIIIVVVVVVVVEVRCARSA